MSLSSSHGTSQMNAVLFGRPGKSGVERMITPWSDLVAPVRDLGIGDALDGWRWLTGDQATPVLLTALGDLFVQTPTGEVSFLDSYDGQLVLVAGTREAWKSALQQDENLHVWFMPALVTALRDGGLLLAEGQCYSPIHPPVLGGSMTAANFEPTSWRVHLGIMGQIHEQVKGLPPGTPITGVKLS